MKAYAKAFISLSNCDRHQLLRLEAFRFGGAGFDSRKIVILAPRTSEIARPS